MPQVRYDHRHLAFRYKIGESTDSDDDLSEHLGEMPKGRKHSTDLWDGYLGKGRSEANAAFMFEKRERHVKLQSKMVGKRRNSRKNSRRGTMLFKQSKEVGIEADPEARVRFDNMMMMDTITECDDPLHERNLNGTDNLMVQLEEKQKQREKEKMEENYTEIKNRMTEIIEGFGSEFGLPDEDEELNFRLLTDPDAVKEEDNELNGIRSDIESLLALYALTCQDREDTLTDLYESLEGDESVENFQSNALLEDDDVSSEITMAIDNINQKSRKLYQLFLKLLRLVSTGCNCNQKAQDSKREIDIQKKVVGKFKKLHEEKIEKKEKINTWKYAATEIVDMLASVRKEGATDFDKLEKEFQNLVKAFQGQAELADELQDSVNKQRLMLQKVETSKENSKRENLALRDEFERCKLKLKTTQMKCKKLETQIREMATSEKQKQMEETTIDTPVMETEKVKEMQAEIDNLRKQLLKSEEDLKEEHEKNKKLYEALLQSSSSQDVVTENYSGPTNANTGQLTKVSQSNARRPAKDQKSCVNCKHLETELNEKSRKLNETEAQVMAAEQKLAAVMRESGKNDVRVVAIVKVTEETSTNESNEKVEKIAKGDMEREHVSNEGSNEKQTLSFQDFALQTSDTLLKTLIPPTEVRYAKEKLESDLSSNISDDVKEIQRRIFRFVKIAAKFIQKPDKMDPKRHVLHETLQEDTTIENEASRMQHDLSQEEILQQMPQGRRASKKDKQESDEQNLQPLLKVKVKEVKKQSIPQQRRFSENDENAKIRFNQTSSICEMCGHDNSRPMQRSEKKGVDFGMQGSQEMAHESEHFPPLPDITSAQDKEGLQRSWTESGFFDNPQEGDSNVDNVKVSGWEKVRQKKVTHILRFLNNIAGRKCSHLKGISDASRTGVLTDAEALTMELNNFAIHAMDVVKVISFVSDQISNNNVKRKGSNVPMLSQLKPTWEPIDSIEGSQIQKSEEEIDQKGQQVQFNHQETPKTDEHFFPDINTSRPSSPVTTVVKKSRPSSASPPKNNQEKMTSDAKKHAKVAEKKRLKILERHRKLVERLKASGVGMKSIYTILGISVKGIEEEIEEQETQQPFEQFHNTHHARRGKNISLVGHAYRTSIAPTSPLPQVSHYREQALRSARHNFGIHLQPPQLGIDLRGRHNAAPAVKRRGNNANGTVFPPLAMKNMNASMTLNNFFKTKPLASLRKM